jgi:hypothetical protein
MLRIVFSRAALFPWLGLVLLAIGAAFPGGDTVGMVLVVVGANVAFYSLRDFSEHFEWGEDTRPMLNLCGVLFLLGFGLILAATQFDATNRWVAVLCTGLYLCLFAVWIVQRPVGLGYNVIAFVGTFLMIIGGTVAYFGWQEWQVFAESDATPQDITLADLQRNGYGTNRFVRLKEFRFCNDLATEAPGKKSKVADVWVPVVAVDGQAVKAEGPSPTVPARVEAVAAYFSLAKAGPAPRPAALDPLGLLRKAKETQGYECVVVTGIKKLKPEVREQLAGMAPQTDLDALILLDWRKPPSAAFVYGFLGGGGTAMLVGWLGLCVVYIRAIKVAGLAPWKPPSEGVPSDESQPAAGQG